HSGPQFYQPGWNEPPGGERPVRAADRIGFVWPRDPQYRRFDYELFDRWRAFGEPTRHLSFGFSPLRLEWLCNQPTAATLDRPFGNESGEYCGNAGRAVDPGHARGTVER